jgi:hypothetical protein
VALPTPGGPNELPQLVEQIAHGVDSSPPLVRALFAIRSKIGSLLGLDGNQTGVGSRVASLRDQLPADLRDAPQGPEFTTTPFTPVYLLHDEFAAEIANRTVHAGDAHRLGRGSVVGRWLPRPDGRACAAQPPARGAYMALIDRFRRWIVYPSLMRDIGAGWRDGGDSQAAPA